MGCVGQDREVREKGLLNYVCFFPGRTVQGQYAAEFDQNLRLHDPVFLQIPELRLIREQACREGASGIIVPNLLSYLPPDTRNMGTY